MCSNSILDFDTEMLHMLDVCTHSSICYVVLQLKFSCFLLQILHKRLSTENVMIVSGFHLKLTGMDYDVPVVHRGGTVSRLRRSPSVSFHFIQLPFSTGLL